MTVTTETVTSIPQASIATAERGGAGKAEAAGTLRTKRSNDTIRPKKERKRSSKKPASVNAASCTCTPPSDCVSCVIQHQTVEIKYMASHAMRFDESHDLQCKAGRDFGSTDSLGSLPSASPASSRFHAFRALRTMCSYTNLRTREASTRADVFEDRVKNAMEEATSDDSDETFVYESNPPENQNRPSRHHSRTPSGASLASMTERGIMRSIAKALEQRPVPKIRSMKFASNNSNYGTADEDGEAHNGTVRARDRTGSSMQHHHMGRQNRNGTGPSSLLDEENPLFPLSKTRSLTAVGGRGSHAARMAAQQLRNSSVKRGDGYSSLDMDADVADDERTPLVGTVRTPRSTRNQRPSRYRYTELRHPSRPRKSVVTKIMGCLIILLTVSILSFGVVCFLFAMCKPLTELTIVNITNVIASEQELMLDLVIEAVNPNIAPVTITDMDVNVFAKSKYVGSEKWWRDHPNIEPAAPDAADRAAARRLRKAQPIKIAIPSPDAEPPMAKDPTAGQTLLLGHVAAFDNPLTFDGSFWERRVHRSTGSLRLSKPGNRTELGGTERWERVLKHDFELLVRGVLLYSKPLGGWAVKVPVNGGTVVDGSGDDDDDDDFWARARV
jgi:Vacuolar segregation subunit 7